MTDKDREAFEAWAFDFLKQQYSFYDAEVIKGMMLPHKSERRTLEAAWQAASAHYAPMLTQQEFVSAFKEEMHKEGYGEESICCTDAVTALESALSEAGVRWKEEA